MNAGLADVVMPSALPIEHEDGSGGRAQSWLFMPSGVTTSELKGLVVMVYPASVYRGAWNGPLSLTFGLRPQLMAGAGYAVLSAYVPGHAGGSADALTAHVNRAVDAALAQYPALPSDRIAIMGHSFGGNAALWIATRSTRYRSYIAWAGSTEMFGHWGELAPVARILPEEGTMMRNSQGWVEVGQGALASPPWRDVDAYTSASSMLFADRISAPVLLITADRDFVPMSQSEEMYSALHRLGRRSRLITYWGEEHMLWSPANITDQYAQVFMWLEETLNARGTEPSS